MAKEFQEYNKQFAKFAGTALIWIAHLDGYRDSPFVKQTSDDFHQWPNEFKKYYKASYTHAEVRSAVYEAYGAESWQQFRVRMKGLGTRNKLYCLAWWVYSHSHENYPGDMPPREWIRVNNYLGALVRGGQLDSDLRVRKDI